MNHILIVEDEAILVKALRDNLEVEGYTVSAASNGEEAIKEIQKQRPKIILLDILMPKSDGFYVLEKVKKNPEWKQITIIVLSNLSGDQEIKRALDMNANDYFVKSQHPIKEVVEKVKEYLGEKKPAKSSPVKKGVQKTILVVEDDIVLSSTLSDNLKQAGYEVIGALDGEEGLALALKKKPDLILLDIILPKMDGITLLKKLRRDAWGKNASVIILTNLNSPNNIAEAVEWAEDYLVKSEWRIEDIIKRIKDKLGK